MDALACRVEAIEPEGIFGALFRDGKARATRFARALSELTQQIQPLTVKSETLLQGEFTSREITRKMGQCAPAGTKKVVGRGTAVQFGNAEGQEKGWSAK